ncbi:hypothetical protein LOTGIDRAFT_189116 [Lottia gigantea]|uniref:EF-hand domain-containing protein n=1 Tax=Lottia gigantea TaxID=225164 RepID=V4ALG7_LOTGI|nr:hypothetical protein LOTGIDRAFT_189116 [Lottia gigantea]ESO94431.1 hypothetical protein LOTGIDRAFT_189116 [Lottia gigantea]
MGNRTAKAPGPQSLSDFVKKKEFTQEELKEWSEIFKRHSGNKEYLTEDEFTEVYGMAFTGDPRPFIKHMFRSFDSNRDGVVDYKEFLTGIGCSTSEDTKTKLSWAFQMYDVDGDGLITKHEIISIIRAMQCMINQHPTDEEIQQTVNDIFRNLDRNNDSQISWDEFYKGVQKDPKLLEVLDCEPQTV